MQREQRPEEIPQAALIQFQLKLSGRDFNVYFRTISRSQVLFRQTRGGATVRSGYCLGHLVAERNL